MTTSVLVVDVGSVMGDNNCSVEDEGSVVVVVVVVVVDMLYLFFIYIYINFFS